MKYKIHLKQIIAGCVILGLIFMLFLIGKDIWKNNSYRLIGQKHLSLSDGKKELFWFDTIHSNNPKDIMFRYLEEAFNKFEPDLVLVEGGYDSFVGSREEAILNGESSFATYLAKESNIIVEDIEPPLSAQLAYLQTKYAAKQILAMYALRQIGSYELLSNSNQINFEEEVVNLLDELKENGLDYGGTNVADVLRAVNLYLPQKMTAENWRDLKVYRIYAREDNEIGSIYNDVVNYRNIYLTSLIEKKKGSYNRIFIVMGNAHKEATENKLRSIYNN